MPTILVVFRTNQLNNARGTNNPDAHMRERMQLLGLSTMYARCWMFGWSLVGLK
jgi:hypothetical protein